MIEFYVDKAGQHRWRAIAGNGQTVATGHQGYASKQKAEQGLAATRKALKKAKPKTWKTADFTE